MVEEITVTARRDYLYYFVAAGIGAALAFLARKFKL